jgi:hypothetical protein
MLLDDDLYTDWVRDTWTRETWVQYRDRRLREWHAQRDAEQAKRDEWQRAARQEFERARAQQLADAEREKAAAEEHNRRRTEDYAREAARLAAVRAEANRRYRESLEIAANSLRIEAEKDPEWRRIEREWQERRAAIELQEQHADALAPCAVAIGVPRVTTDLDLLDEFDGDYYHLPAAGGWGRVRRHGRH